MVGGNQRQDRAQGLKRLLGEKVIVRFRSGEKTYSTHGTLEHCESEGFNFGYYVEGNHIPIKALIGRKWTKKEFEVNLNYLNK